MYVMTYEDVQYIEMFSSSFTSMNNILNVALFKHSLHKIRETILDQLYQLIYTLRSIRSN